MSKMRLCVFSSQWLKLCRDNFCTIHMHLKPQRDHLSISGSRISSSQEEGGFTQYVVQNIPVLSPACPWLREKRQRYCQFQLCPGMVSCGLREREGTVIEWAGSGHTRNTCPNPTLSSEMQVEDAPWRTRWLSSRH